MKKFLSGIFALALTCSAFSQSTELSFRLNSGVGNFSGESAQDVTFMIYSIVTEDGHTHEPFGSEFGVSYGAAVNLAHILDNGIRLGAELGYDLLRTKAEINSVLQHGESAQNATFDAEGAVNMNVNFLNLFPHVGYRYTFSEINFDFDAGVDLGYALSITEKGNAETEAREYKTSLQRENIDFDVRPRLQLGVSGYNIGGYIAYSKGITNYLSGGSNEAYLNVIRVGVFYKMRLRGRDHLIFRRR